MLNNNDHFKDEMPYKGPFDIMQYCTNGAFTLQVDAIKTKFNIHHMKPSKTNYHVGYFTSKAYFL